MQKHNTSSWQEEQLETSEREKQRVWEQLTTKVIVEPIAL